MKVNLKSLILLGFVFQLACCQVSTFSNPIVDFMERDAVVMRIDDFYYLAHTDRQTYELKILKSPYLTDFRNAEQKAIYSLPSGYLNYFQSHFLSYKGDIYLYFHMSKDDMFHMFAIKADNPKNPMGRWNTPVRVVDDVWKNYSSHGAVLQLNEQLYFVWIGPSDSGWSLYIAKMLNPTKIIEPVVLLREPTEEWECFNKCQLDAPAFLSNRDKVYMVFSTGGEAFMSYISIRIGLDPLDPSNWESHPGPIFQGNAEENVYSPRYPEFTTSSDGTETWMLYTASSNSSDLGGSSRIRVDMIEWNKVDGSPIFPETRANGFQQQLPSGEPSKYYNPVNGNISPAYPNAYRVDDVYYLVSRGPGKANELVILKSDKLYDFSNAEASLVYTAAEGTVVSAGRIFEISGETYLYFHTQNAEQRYWLYVSKAENTSNLMQNWGPPTRLLADVLDGQAFHPTILQHNNKNYFVWVIPNNTIYIAPMSSPTEIIEPIVNLKHTCSFYPCFLYYKNIAVMVFSTGASQSFMSIENGKDPLDTANWYRAPAPVFTSNDAENVYDPGRAWFTTSPDGLEDWMMYMASENASNIVGSRSVRIQKISWDEETGDPIFPTARGFSYPLVIPSTFKYFTNPITDDTTVSPAVIRVGSFYYMLLSTEGNSEIKLLKSGKLHDFRNAEEKVVYSVPDGFLVSGSSKIHHLNGQLYIYFSMEASNHTAKMYVIQAHDPSNPMGLWDTNPVLLAPSWDYSAIHSTVFEHGDNFYLVWISPHPATGFNSIFIGQMKNATHVMEPFNLIRHPMELWECDGACSNEAPYFIYNEGTAYMVHSVGAACNGGNALTYMSVGKNEDPLNIVTWNKADGKVFSESRDENVLCPAHATFTVSPNGKETWMVYHATDSPHPDAVRTARIQRITWDQSTTEPVFQEPHGFYHQQVVPSRK